MYKGTKKFTICMTKNYDVILFLVTLHYSDQKIIPITPVSLWWLYRPSGVCLTNLKMCHTLHEKTGISTYPNQYCICDDKNSKASYSTFASAPHTYVIFTIVPKLFFIHISGKSIFHVRLHLILPLHFLTARGRS